MSAPTTDPFGLTGAVLEGRFAIERPVAKGGFGVVYRGTHLSLRRPVALKVLFCPPGLDAHKRQLFLDGFEQEAQTIAALDHPAIVRVIDFGVSLMPDDTEAPWMVLEWVEGVSLEQYLRALRTQRLSPTQALDLLRPVFQALSFAHDQQIAHRDVKPSNIMLVQRAGLSGPSLGGQVHVKLLDFGVAKLMSPDESVGSGETQTHAQVLAFSIPYASPEQKAAMKTGPWTDVHALGLILTEALTGSTPYPGVDRLEVEQRITAPVRPTPALFGVDVGAWEPVIARAVALRSPDRYQHAGAFYEALVEALPAAHPSVSDIPTNTEPVDVWAAVMAATSAPPSSTQHTYTVPPSSTSVPHERRPSRGVVAAVAVATLALSVVGGVGLRAAYSRASTAIPAPVRVAPPAPSVDVAPSALPEAPVEAAPSVEPAPSVVAEPAAPSVEPAPSVVAEPAPSVVAEPAPSVVAEPAAPSVTAEPAPSVLAEPAAPSADPSPAHRRAVTTVTRRTIRNRLRD